ncbi:NAD(P)/FAD-dependent oxidoreductase [Kosmotoga pacifica]|uniref:FAD/NAD(P)-binding domain-containing protein n=1 Tax=Kosmotoga pacifica TaxID=1330330 RepID=A0A0G2ZD08_9BACT|nr:NAD(P)/FAD-dependent oxidoreductase [Kosmotoga pacifica]AKI96683.1 hypothetical protein IX53_01325 [Kosmotoga pacifica]
MFVEVAIVGAGPAGITCAIQLEHHGIEFSLIEKERIGGLLLNANLVENLPLLPPIPGKEVVKMLKNTLERRGIDILYATVRTIEKIGSGFVLHHSDGIIQSRYIVLATGTLPKRIKAFEVSPRIVYEPFKLFDVVGKCIAIAGSGEAAFDAALNLAKRNNVVLFTKHEPHKVSPKLIERASKLKNIELKLCEPVKSVQVKGDGLLISTKASLAFYDYLLISIGRRANNGMISEDLLNCEELFLAGDVKRGALGQATMAMGDGMEAAQKIIERLRRRNRN